MRVMVTLQDRASVEVLAPLLISYPWPEGSSFRIVHIVDPVMVNSFMSFLPSPLTKPVAEERWIQGEKLVKDFVEELRQAKEFTFEEIEEKIVEGDAKIEISEMLVDWKPDMVVVGSRQKEGLQSLGSVSRAIVAECKSSIMVVPLLERATN